MQANTLSPLHVTDSQSQNRYLLKNDDTSNDFVRPQIPRDD